MRGTVTHMLYGLTAVFRRIYHHGHSYQCPFCYSHLKMFLPYGDDLPVLKKMQVRGAGRRVRDDLKNSCAVFPVHPGMT
jgi:hypothetical protein